MKLLVISSSDSKGGASVVARSLVQGMRERGHAVTFLVASSEDPDAKSIELVNKDEERQTRSFFGRAIHRLGINQLALESDFPRRQDAVRFSEFDVIHLHDFASLNFRYLPWLTRQARFFWTIHSMAPITGNCIYSYECEKWKNSCGKCPQFGRWPLNWAHRDGSALNLRFKRWVYGRANIHVIGVSQWISDRVRQSVMGHVPISTVQNAVDTRRFRPMEKAEAKRRVGIDPARFSIAFSVAGNPADTRKGADIVREAMAMLKPDSPVTFMPMSINQHDQQLTQMFGSNCDTLAPRHLATDVELRTYYCAADVIWHPSRADTSSMVSLEAMACGTPVIAAAVGGVPEVVGDAGTLIYPDSPEGLVTATHDLINNREHWSELCEKAVQRVNNQFTIDRFIDEHEELYSQ